MASGLDVRVGSSWAKARLRNDGVASLGVAVERIGADLATTNGIDELSGAGQRLLWSAKVSIGVYRISGCNGNVIVSKAPGDAFTAVMSPW